MALVRDLDRAIFRKRWSGIQRLVGGEDEGEERVGLPDGLRIVWNNKLRSTAGQARFRTTKVEGRYITDVSVELSIKVLDTEEKLIKTLAHELCHVAAWTLSGEMKPPHGAAFKLWFVSLPMFCLRKEIEVDSWSSFTGERGWRKCDRTFTSLPVTLMKLCSSIVGNVNPALKCEYLCFLTSSHHSLFQSLRFGRHSKSIDITRHGCNCGSQLREIDTEGKVKIPRVVKKSAWDEFRLASPSSRHFAQF